MKIKHGISVIVPVYNVEKYLHKCVDSLLAGWQKNIEIILVDDGSSDESPKICDMYAKQEPDKIKVFHQKNGGLSAARNKGIEKAQYDYLWFVDSDDWIVSQALSVLMKKIDDDFDLVNFDTYEIYDGQDVGKIRKTYTGDEDTDIRQFVLYSTDPAFACARMYKASLFKNIKFPVPDLWYEDIATIPIILSYCKKVERIDKPFYYYRQRMGSITTKSQSERNLELIDGCKRVLELGNPIYKEELELAVYYALSTFVNFRPKFMDEYLAFVRENSERFQQNKYIQAAIEKNLLIDLTTIKCIPKIIHYFWFGGAKPESVTKCIESWKKFAPDYVIKEWNESNCDIKENRYAQEAYENKKYAFTSDYFRIKKLYEDGGIYMDTDIELFDNIDSLRNNDLFFPFETDFIGTCIMGAIPQHPLMKKILDSYQERTFILEDGQMDMTANPVVISKFLREKYNFSYTGNTVMLPDRVTLYSPDILVIDVGNGQNIAVHHYEATWWTVKTDKSSYKYQVLQYYFVEKYKNEPHKKENTFKKIIFVNGRNFLHFILPKKAFVYLRKKYRNVKPIR